MIFDFYVTSKEMTFGYLFLHHFSFLYTDFVFLPVDLGFTILLLTNMVLTRVQRRRLSEAGVSPNLDLLACVASDSTPSKTPSSTPEKELLAPEVAPVSQPFDYLCDVGVDLGGCDDELTIEVVEVGNTN